MGRKSREDAPYRRARILFPGLHSVVMQRKLTIKACMYASNREGLEHPGHLPDTGQHWGEDGMQGSGSTW